MALASVQIGIPKRLIYLKNTNLEMIQKLQRHHIDEKDKDYNEAKVLINPLVKEKIGLTEYWEACASCLDNLGCVQRSYQIKVEYYNENGEKQEEIFEGFAATVLSHELDHLDGILHIDIAEKILHMSVTERKKFRQTHDYKIINKEGIFEMEKAKYDLKQITKLSPKEKKKIPYKKLVQIMNQLSPEEIQKLSKDIGYPVFTRMCMGELKHKFILLQCGAATIILNEKNQVLLQRRADNNNWGLPGGCQELGERFEDTIIREIKEETNLDVTEEDLHLVAIISGESRKRTYPNGDMVINNTVLYYINHFTGN